MIGNDNMETTRLGTKTFYPQPWKQTIGGRYDFDEDDFMDDRLVSIPGWMKYIIYTTELLYDDDSTVTAKAVCDDRDIYDEETGIDIVSEKLDMKFHKKISNKCFKMADALQQVMKVLDNLGSQHYKKYMAIKTDIENYYGGDNNR